MSGPNFKTQTRIYTHFLFFEDRGKSCNSIQDLCQLVGDLLLWLHPVSSSLVFPSPLDPAHHQSTCSYPSHNSHKYVHTYRTPIPYFPLGTTHFSVSCHSLPSKRKKKLHFLVKSILSSLEKSIFLSIPFQFSFCLLQFSKYFCPDHQ